MLNMQNSKIYETAVLKTKQEDFLAFLRSLGIQRDEVIFQSNKDYYLYSIDLSRKNPSSRSFIRHKLNEAQIEFL